MRVFPHLKHLFDLNWSLLGFLLVESFWLWSPLGETKVQVLFETQIVLKAACKLSTSFSHLTHTTDKYHKYWTSLKLNKNASQTHAHNHTLLIGSSTWTKLMKILWSKMYQRHFARIIGHCKCPNWLVIDPHSYWLLFIKDLQLTCICDSSFSSSYLVMKKIIVAVTL